MSAPLLQGSNSLPNSGNGIATVAGDLVIGVIATANPRTVSTGSGFAVADALPAAPNTKLLTEYRLLSAAGSAAATATLNTSDTWAALMAAFKPASSGGILVR